MPRGGAIGLNSGRTYTATSAAIGIPAALLDRFADNRGEWLFVKADGALVQYGACLVDPTTGKAKTCTTGNITGNYGFVGGIVGIAQVAAADADYLWIWVGRGGGTGVGIKVLVAASYVAGAKLYSTGTTGVLDDAATTAILGVVGMTTDSGSGSSVEVWAGGYINLAQ